MFKKNGEWKEFGVNNSDTTIFPFWLFCIVLAVVTYATISFFVIDDTVDYVKSVSTASSIAATVQAVAATPPPKTLNLTPEEIGANTVDATPAKPGYYRLNDSLMKKKGVPRYIYVGEDKPEDLDE
jgi:hypothetical protein